MMGASHTPEVLVSRLAAVGVSPWRVTPGWLAKGAAR
jgi:hypothetical protein